MGTGRMTVRERIIVAAADLFRTSGFEDATLESVAHSADVARKTVFNHFGDKRSLLKTIIIQELRKNLSPEYVETQEIQFGDARDALLQRPRMKLDDIVRNRAILTMGVQNIGTFLEGNDEEESIRYNNKMAREHRISKLQEIKSIRIDIDPATIQRAFMMILHGVIRNWLLDSSSTKSDLFLGYKSNMSILYNGLSTTGAIDQDHLLWD